PSTCRSGLTLLIGLGTIFQFDLLRSLTEKRKKADISRWIDFSEDDASAQAAKPLKMRACGAGSFIIVLGEADPPFHSAAANAAANPAPSLPTMVLIHRSCRIIPRRVQFCVNTAAFDELRARSLFHHASMFENDDLIHPVDRRQPMSHNQSGSPLHQRLDGFHHPCFSSRVER